MPFVTTEKPATTSPVQQGSMHAALFHKPGDVRYEETAIPDLKPGELLVKVDTALTCGTDLKCFRRGHPVLLKTFPSPFGHECAGTIAAIGEGVSKFKIGDRVVAANSAPCFNCNRCHKGQHNLCENLDLLNGAYADYLKIPAQIASHNTYRLPEHVSFEQAAFCEPLAVSVRGVALSRITAGTRVAVMGLGPIGQLLVKAAKLKGAHVTALARNPLKRELAKTFGGADAVINFREINGTEEIKQQFTPNGAGFDVVIEAIGLTETWEKAIDLVAPGGLVNLFGGCQSGSKVQLDTKRLHYEEISIISLFHHTPQYFNQALELISTGKIDPTPLITNILPLSKLTDALQLIENGDAVKVAIKPKLDAK